MSRASRTVLVMLAVLGCSAPALAADDASGLALGVTGGTNGLGLEASYRINSMFGVRANSGSFNYDKSADSGDFNIDGKAKLSSFGALVDFYPFGGSFRISAGLRSNSNKFSGDATPTGATVDVGGDTYTAAEVGVLTGAAKFKKTSPTVTIGWGGKFRSGLHVGAEIGVVAQGSPKLSASSDGTLASNSVFQQSLDAQLAEWQDDVKDYKLWPVIQLHVMYRF